jgi:hypothetical protein
MNLLFRIAALLVLLYAPLARASVVMALSVEELARRSDLVVFGEVVSVQTTWASDHRHISRRVIVKADESWKGHAPNEVEIVLPGGEIDGVGEQVVGEPTLAQGVRGVFFLEPVGGVHRVIGLSQGFFMSSSAGLVQRTEDLALVHPNAGGYQISDHGAAAIPPVSVADLRTRVTRALVETRPSSP